MGWFDNDPKVTEYNDAAEGGHHAKISHELLAAAASYEAAKAYENHVAANGKPDSHAKAKELISSFTGAFIDREAESRGLNFIDKEKAKHAANERAHQALADSGDY